MSSIKPEESLIKTWICIENEDQFLVDEDTREGAAEVAAQFGGSLIRELTEDEYILYRKNGGGFPLNTSQELCQIRKDCSYLFARYPHFYQLVAGGYACDILDYYEDKPIFLAVSTTKMVCPECDGEGTELRGGLKGYTYTQQDMDDPDFREHMSQVMDGRYDVPCSKCDGKSVLVIPDTNQLGPDQIKIIFKMLVEEDNAVQESAAEDAAERRMGC